LRWAQGRDETAVPGDQLVVPTLPSRCVRVSYVRIVNNHFQTGDVMVNKFNLVEAVIRRQAIRGAALRGAALSAVVAAAGLGFAVAAGAQTVDNAPKLVVRYSPASLDSDRGVRELYGRLVAAAEKVCVEPQVGRFPSEAVTACRRQAVIDAVAQIHNSRLAELSAHRSKSG